ncbi:MAG TPA: nucleoside monophosphate kinase [Lacunisphaera sp.]|jgi:adenylate kinase|nr:nucleoside monophosphate kinase [Lacunisphaera sp.]
MTPTPVRDRTAWLQGGDAVCLQPPPLVHRTWRLVLLGPPGVGKGTQAELLSRALGACPLSTGDVFRAAKDRELEPGSAMARARVHMVRGELVPDAIVVDLVRERCRCLHCNGGFMLDGFPRTRAQALMIDELLAAEHIRLDAVVCFDLPEGEILGRITGRRVCPQCKAVFHVASRPPKRDGVCDACGAALVQRADDRPEAVKVRLEAYTADTEPLIQHYAAKNLLVRIDAARRPDEVFARTLDALAALVVPA